jgi:hypothetical protein
MGKERVHSEALCEYRRILLKWNLSNCFRIEFGYSCFGRMLNGILTNCAMNHKLHKILDYIMII